MVLCIAFGCFIREAFGFDMTGQLVSVFFTVLIFSNGELIEYCRRFFSLFLNIITFVLICRVAVCNDINYVVNVSTIIILAMTIISSLLSYYSALLIFPLSASYFAVAEQFSLIFGNGNVAFCFIAIILLLSVTLSYCIFNTYVYDKEKRSLDCFAISRVLGLAAYCGNMRGEYQNWLFIWLIGIVIASFLRKGNKPLTNRIIISFAMSIPVVAWWARPFARLLEFISVEVNIIPILLYIAALRLLKWDKKHIDSLTFITYVIVYVILFFNALNGAIVNAVILMASAFIILVVSFFVRMKRWFVLSTSVITVSAICLSIKQWGSPAWWVYLLVAGIILIAVGAFNERKKNSVKGELTEKITRFMSEWTW